ncbi:F-actin-monooxygenase MICAL2-like [Trichechus inunguis]
MAADEPTSPKKPKSVPEPQPSVMECEATSPLPSEWTSVRISPGGDTVGQDVLAVRVLVTSDDTSSETESECGNETSCVEPCEERPQQLEPSPLPKPLTRPISLHKALTKAVSPQCPDESEAVHALQQANSFQSPTPSKYTNWRRKFQSNLTPVNNKRTVLPPEETSLSPSSLSSSSSSSPSASIASSTSNVSSSPQVTAYSRPSQVSRDHFSPSRTIFLGQTRAQGAPKEIPLDLPHHDVLGQAEYCLVSPGEDGLTSPRPHSPGMIGSDECQEVEASFGDSRSIQRGPHPFGRKDSCLTDQHLSLKAGKDTRERSTGPRRGEGGSEMTEEKKSGLKKLVLTQEQKTKFLDWSDAISAGLQFDVGEQPSQKSSENNRGNRVLKPVCPLTLPQATKETLSSHKSTQEKVGTLVEQASGEPSVSPPKSPLWLIANAIRRSLEPLLPNSEGGKKIWAKPKSKILPTSQPHTCTRSFSLRKTNYNKDWDQQSQGRDMTRRASSFFSLGALTAKASQPSDLSPPDPAVCTHSLPNHSTKIFPEPVSPPCRMIEDVPTLLEKVSLQETLPHTSRVPNRRLSLFSSLRLKDKSLESFLHESKQRTDVKDLLSSRKGKVLPVDNAHSLEKLVQPLNNTSLGQVGHPPPAGNSRPKHIPNQAQVTETDSSLSSSTSFSADEEFDPQPSLQSKERKTLRRQKKLEKATKQLIKQEELKRLHKAQAIQRQLEEVEERQRAFEIQGVRLEKALRGEAADSGTQDEAQLLQEWFKLALEKNKLMRYESELLIMARELELEDHQSRLEQKLRKKMLKEESQKDENDLNEEQQILTKMMQVIEQRDKLVDSLEEQRIREKAEDQHFESFIFSRGCQQSRT